MMGCAAWIGVRLHSLLKDLFPWLSHLTPAQRSRLSVRFQGHDEYVDMVPSTSTLVAQCQDHVPDMLCVWLCGCVHVSRYSSATPLEHVLRADSDVLLVTHMNGQQLPQHHGGPLRVLLPGQGGARSVKWLSSIEVRLLAVGGEVGKLAVQLYPGTTSLQRDAPLVCEHGRLWPQKRRTACG